MAAIIPAAATSAALIYVGVLMLQGLKNVDFDDMDQMVPVSLMLIGMPVSGSIGHAIGLGLISYTVIKLFSGKGKEVSVLTYVISAPVPHQVLRGGVRTLSERPRLGNDPRAGGVFLPPGASRTKSYPPGRTPIRPGGCKHFFSVRQLLREIRLQPARWARGPAPWCPGPGR